ncbi:MAG: DUF3575 domain-containing protein [Bacteroidota bacterium]
MRTFLLACILALGSWSLSAQVDAKLNVGSFIFGGLGVAADFSLSENTSLSAGFGYANTDFGSDAFNYKVTRIIPEFRYYLNPERGADKFFVGGYGKLSFTTAEDEVDNTSVDATRGALGILFGNKWVTDGGFLFELNMGLGRGTTFGDGDGEDDFEDAFNTLTAFDFRLGIIAGWRF